eukprot:1472397-Amphidinium_carterae.2
MAALLQKYDLQENEKPEPLQESPAATQPGQPVLAPVAAPGTGQPSSSIPATQIISQTPPPMFIGPVVPAVDQGVKPMETS